MNIWELREELYRKLRAVLASEFDRQMELLLHSWLISYKDNPAFLYEVYDLLETDKPGECADAAKDIAYRSYPDTLIVHKDGKDILIPARVARRGVQLAADALQDYLPLGSVVDLKQEPFSEVFTKGTPENIRIVITQRFVCVPETSTFYHYGGIIYPLGMPDGQRMLYFTHPLIDEVAHVGFTDEMEAAFVFGTKDALVIENNYHSVAFSSGEERETTRRALAAGGEPR
jgi:hypothetical protein